MVGVRLQRAEAAMGPRPEGRGGGGGIDDVLAAVRPQWGRGLKAAEGGAAGMRALPSIRPQWGRGLKAAEGMHATVVAIHCGSPQWGRGLTAAEGLTRSTSLTPPSSRNGAAA